MTEFLRVRRSDASSPIANMLLPFDKALASAGSLLNVGVTVTTRPAR